MSKQQTGTMEEEEEEEQQVEERNEQHYEEIEKLQEMGQTPNTRVHTRQGEGV